MANLAIIGERFDVDRTTGLRTFLELEWCDAPDHQPILTHPCGEAVRAALMVEAILLEGAFRHLI